MTASAIPETWFHITLGDVARVSSGMGFPQKYQGKQEGIYPVYKVGDISNAVINHKGKAFLAGNYVGELEAKELKGEVFSEGATLFAKIGEAIKLNRRAFVTRAGLADNNVMAVIPEKLISKQFIHYFMRTVDLTGASRSTTVPSIRKGDVECLPLNIPSQAEQKEIADRLDILLAQVEATQSRLARIPDIIKHFRQSVLSAASCGFTNGDVSYKKLNVLVDMLNGARRPVSASKRNDIKGNIPYYGATGVVDYLDNYTHEGRFLLVGEDGANLLSKNKDLAFIIDGKSWVNNHAHVLKAKVDVSLDFIKIVINSLDLSPWVTGSAQPKLTKRALIELPVPFFSYKEQTEIVRRVEQLFAYADTLEQQAKAAKARVDKLTQAMLAKAFRGELTADWRAANPDLISGDHSAAALLARIQAERATAKPRKRATKKSAT